MGRSPCCSKVGLQRGPWTSKEDALLVKYIQDHGEGQWRSLPKKAGLLRCGKSCRLRWMNYLRPDVKRGNITADEDDLIVRMHALLGNRWSLIAGRLPGRTDNEIKNYWNTHLSKKLRSQGIDPITHKNFHLPDGENIFTNNFPKKKKTKNKCNMEAAEKTTKKNVNVHIPKPVRFTSSTSRLFFLKTKNNSPHDQSLSPGPGDHSSNNSGDNGLGIFIHGIHNNDHPVDDGGSNDLELQADHVPPEPLNKSDLDKIYEEYLQLLKTEDNCKPKVDSYVVSISI
ncbi:hypothetical protein ACH5RR_000053 [Cinchona calisaya]|uniref:Uncharacterized protein n=1 Tax=Cinchona calisaya TaxID=153742 RepID=A0ABD3AZJ8_9GENT